MSKKAFQDKYSPKVFRDAKRNEFLKLVQEMMTMAKYEKKYTELSKYVITIIVDEVDWCKRFKEGLWEEIRTSVTASAKWVDFSKLVETAMRVERSLAERKMESESVRSERPIYSTSAIHDQSGRSSNRRSVSGMSGRGNFKSRLGWTGYLQG